MITFRVARELTYQLEMASEHDRLAQVLASVPVFLWLSGVSDRTDVFRQWQYLTVSGINPEPLYRASLAKARNINSSLLPDALYQLYWMFQVRGAWDLSYDLLTELRLWACNNGSPTWEIRATLGLGVIRWRRAEYDDAMKHLERSLELSEKNHDLVSVSFALGNMGNVYRDQGQYADATKCFERHYTIANSLNDKLGMSRAITNLGIVRREQEQLEEARACFEEALQLAQSFGDRSIQLYALGNMGALFVDMGRLDEATTYLSEHLALAERLGDRRGMAATMTNFGNIQAVLGRYEAALHSFEKQLAVSESLGEKKGVGEASFAVAKMHLKQGTYESALQYTRRSLDTFRAIGVLTGVGVTLAQQAQILLETVSASTAEQPAMRPFYLDGVIEESTGSTWQQSTLQAARSLAEESVSISQQVAKQDALFLASILLARIDAAEGNLPTALKTLEIMLSKTTDGEQIADLHYWLWKMGSERPVRSTHHDDALARYESLYLRIPKFEFLRRIADLRGQRIPMSADDLEA
ncbi:MAG: tetratricopeptide repeat protein [Bacteroidota bacterium]|nr:tetratricopeptide repeat protein [Bacteroidota bacterium]MDP4232674.1 tetratricopeptide repeat protein [Bacteroidota bacterium]MDP4243193.1 tetratricopeptide repeat protein [Bacteroidota bacterium]MDP4288405.1 tetratricopeptide repeat protein [Bacteroidota bacterium]